ncbi:hypothetical protein [Chthoniobacter sp.]|uniref:hypothetical protein n=1 Tax=Chthoniobacter sp. TaxID=2510640 RepID=UPI0032AF052D
MKAWFSKFFAVVLAMIGTGHALADRPEPQMSWLDNGTIRLGVDLQIGGAITWLSRSGDTTNLINSFDWGRQVQMSYYAGPVPFIAGTKHPAKNWEGLGWNPIQVGDTYGHRARLLEQRNDGHALYVKCVPMQWPLDDVPGECTFESMLELDGPVVHARCRLVNARSDHTLYPARTQELPAVYTNGPWHRIISYTGAKPFTHDAVTQLEAKPPPQWNGWDATENWSALVDDAGWGLGVWNPGAVRFGGGFNAQPGAGGPKDNPCGYLAPQRVELLDHDITHEYRYDLVLGTVEEIRAHVYRQPRDALPAWRFASDRQGWRYERATDTGWPIRDALAVQLTQDDPALLSPRFVAHAEAAPVLVIDAAFKNVAAPHGQVFWASLEQPGFEQSRSLRFDGNPDGAFHEYRIRLSDSPAYRGAITQLRFDPADHAGGTVRIRAIHFAGE